MKITVTIELKHLSGPSLDEETVLDAFAATIGHQNGARDKAVQVRTYVDSDAIDREEESVYQVWLVDA